jgi:hypothetical protein
VVTLIHQHGAFGALVLGSVLLKLNMSCYSNSTLKKISKIRRIKVEGVGVSGKAYFAHYWG